MYHPPGIRFTSFLKPITAWALCAPGFAGSGGARTHIHVWGDRCVGHGWVPRGPGRTAGSQRFSNKPVNDFRHFIRA